MTTKKTKLNRYIRVWVLLLLAGVGLIVFGTLTIKHQRAISQEKKAYSAAEADITAFVDEAAKLATSTKEITKQCRYASAKYSKGSLGCNISGKVKYELQTSIDTTTVEALLDTKPKALGWKFRFDNTESMQELYPDIVSNKVYSFKNLECGIIRKSTDNPSTGQAAITVNIDCSGLAMREYYPVVDY